MINTRLFQLFSVKRTTGLCIRLSEVIMMTMRQQAVAQMQFAKKAVPSDTPYPFGLSKEENAALACPFAPLSECEVTVHPAGYTTIAHGKPDPDIMLPASLAIARACRIAGVPVEQADIVWG